MPFCLLLDSICILPLAKWRIGSVESSPAALGVRRIKMGSSPDYQVNKKDTHWVSFLFAKERLKVV